MAYCCDTESEDFEGTKVACRKERGDGWWVRFVGGRERGDEMGEDEDLERCLKDVDCVVEVVIVICRLIT